MNVFVVISVDTEFDHPILGVYSTRETAEEGMVLFLDCVCNEAKIIEVELDSFELPYNEDPEQPYWA